METPRTILQDNRGNFSSTRAIGVTVVGNAILMLWACIVFGFFHPDSFSAAVGTGVGLFTAVTTGTFVYLYNNKKRELSNEEFHTANDNPIKKEQI